MADPCRIAILAGDGVGPEVMEAALLSLDVLERVRGRAFERDFIPGGGRYYSEHGQEWPEDAPARVRGADAVLVGAVGHEDESGRTVRRADGELAGYDLVIGVRMDLDLYANIRPVKLFPGVQHRIHGELRPIWSPEHVDMVIVRENTEDAYAPGFFHLTRGGTTELVVSPTLITRKGAVRVIRRAFEIARRRSGAPADGVRRVTCVDKSNIVRAHRFFRDIFREMAADYPDIEQDFAYADAFCQWVVRRPEGYDVVVAPNFAGDVISDLAAVLQGGLGVAAGGNVGDDHAMFEPVHGSAPRHAGKNRVNPVATVLSLRMMFDWLGQRRGDAELCEAGDLLERAVAAVLIDPKGRTYDLGGSTGCAEVGRRIADAFGALLEHPRT